MLLSGVQGLMIRPVYAEQIPPVMAIQPSALIDQSGRSVDLSTLSDNVLVINFWATWCAPCIHELPTLVALANDYADQPVQVMLVNADINARTGFDFLKQRGWDDGVVALHDPGGQWMHTMQVRSLPVTYVVDHQQRVIDYVVGALDWNTPAVQQSIDGWLAQMERQPRPSMWQRLQKFFEVR